MSAHDTSDIPAIRDRMAADRGRVIDAVRRGDIDGKTASQRLSDVTDRNVRLIAERNFGELADRVVLVAGGGNGRREVCPGSDLDIIAILADPQPEGWDQKWSTFYYDLEAAGFPSTGGFRYYTPSQIKAAAIKDDPTYTSLLERRRVWGSQEIFAELDRIVKAIPQNDSDYVARRLSVRNARLKLEKNARHMLEPDIKEGYGGLRDYETLQWIARVINGGNGTPDMVRHEYLTVDDARELEEAHNFMLTLRFHMHDIRGGKHSKGADLLSSEMQERLAERLPGYGSSEVLMQRYYRASRSIGRLANVTCAAIAEDIHNKDHEARKAGAWSIAARELDALAPGLFGWMVDKSREPRSDEAGFVIVGDNIRFDNDGLTDPLQVFSILRRAQKLGLTLHHSAQSEIRKNLYMVDDAFRADPKNSQLFLKILQGRDGSDFLRQMQEIGLLQAYDHNMEWIDALRQFDGYHAYTVDEHTFRCIGNIEKLLGGAIPEKEAFAAGLAGDLNDTDRLVLFLGMYMHDFAKKGEARGEITHPEVGAKWALDKCKALGLGEEETGMISWLFAIHLRLSKMAEYMRPDEPETVRRLAGFIPSVRHLKLLAILTTADVMGLGPDKWGTVKNERIRHLYRATVNFIERNEVENSPVLSLPEGYEPGAVDIRVRTVFNKRATEVVIASPDRNFLFENIVGALGAANMNIIDGDAALHQGNGHGNTIVNRIIFTDSRGLGIETEREAYLRKILAEAVAVQGRGDYAKKIRPHERTEKVYPVRPEVEIANDVGQHETFVKITGRDRPGLLYSLARKFNDEGLGIRCHILAANGHQVRNSFYVVTREGSKVPGERFQQVRAALMECVAE